MSEAKLTAKEWADYIHSSYKASTWTFTGLTAPQSRKVADAIDALLAENAAMRELLKEIKKAFDFDGGTAVHPNSVIGKALMGRLAALLKEAK